MFVTALGLNVDDDCEIAAEDVVNRCIEMRQEIRIETPGAGIADELGRVNAQADFVEALATVSCSFD